MTFNAKCTPSSHVLRLRLRPEIILDGPKSRLRPGPNPELLEDVTNVDLYGRLADEKLARHSAVRRAAR